MALERMTQALQRIEAIKGQIRAIVGQVAPREGRPEETAAAAPGASFANAMASAAEPQGLSSAPEPIRSMLQGAAQRYGVPFPMLESVARRESGFNPSAVSPRGAQGLMQIMPGTQPVVGVTDPFDAGQSVEGGARYLKMMLDKFGGDPSRALAAYNAGPGAVERHNGVPPFAETRDYVNRILGDMSLYGESGEE